MDEKSKYSSIQIRVRIKEEMLNYCNSNGYKVSGLLEKLIHKQIATTHLLCNTSVKSVVKKLSKTSRK